MDTLRVLARDVVALKKREYVGGRTFSVKLHNDVIDALNRIMESVNLAAFSMDKTSNVSAVLFCRV